MSKNIVVITGSPRKGGNSDTLAQSFIKQAEKMGLHVQKFEAAFHRIQPCKACETCWSKNVPCSFEDDFNHVLAKQLEQADAIVFVTPMYWYSFSSQLKLAMDKLYAYTRPQCPNPLKIKESALIVCGTNPSQEAFRGIVQSYEGICSYIGWQNRGSLVFPGLQKKGAVKTIQFEESIGELCKKFLS